MQNACNPVPPARIDEPSDHAESVLLDPSGSGVVTAADVAASVGRPLRTVQRWAHEGRIRAFKPSWCRSWLVPASEVERLVAEGVRRDRD